MTLTLLIVVPIAVGLGLLAIRSAWLRNLLLVLTAGSHLLLVGRLWFQELPRHGWTSFFRLDSPGLILLTLASVLFFVSLLYGIDYLRHERHRGALPRRVYDACLLFFLASMSLVLTSNHLGLLWVAVEATTMASAPLVF